MQKIFCHKKLFFLIFLILVIFNLFLASWYVLNGDIVFNADIARDFHLLREIDRKKFMLIGPRTSSSGLFHGPLWHYLNYPAYLLGNGNPVVVGWGWILMIVLFLVTSFIVADKLFNRATAYLYILLVSVYLVFHARGMSHHQGVFFLLPLFFFLLAKYLETNKINYLISHVLIGGLLIQFEISIGIPYVILSFALLTYLICKRENKKHLLALFLILLPLSNYLVFELRHGFPITNSVKRFLLSHVTDESFSYQSIIKNRLSLIPTGLELPRENPHNIRLFFNLSFAIFIFLQIKHKIHKAKYLLFLYFYFGFFALSFINVGPILYFHLYPQFSLAFLIFASLITSKYQKVFIIIFTLVFILNFSTAISNVKNSERDIGKNAESWKFLFNFSKKIFEQPGDSFGYFVFSPDAFGYQPKYAMFYTASLYPKKAFSLEKKPITYILAAPHPFMKDEWWVKNQVNIKVEPEWTIKNENGYIIRKYLLDKEQINIPFDPAIDPGIHFR